jgi:hypothetical protein
VKRSTTRRATARGRDDSKIRDIAAEDNPLPSVRTSTFADTLSPQPSSAVHSRKLRVSYCTTCHGRLWQLALTLFDNLDHLRDDEEIVLLDYGSPDGLSRFVESSERCRHAINRGQLTYAYTPADRHHCSLAKNLAHRLGRGDLLVNVDADNNIQGMREVIDEYFANSIDEVILHMDDGTAGAFGRICIPRYWFYTLGGYDESFAPSAYQDRDLLKRASASGLRYIWSPAAAPVPIPNTMHEKISHTGQENWHTMRAANRAISEKNLQEGRLVANAHGWGAANLSINFGEEQRFPPVMPNLISVVLCGSKRLSRINELLELYNEMMLVGEILVVSSNATSPFEKNERNDSKVTVVNASGSLGPFSRFAVGAQASFPAVLLTDDRIFLPETTLAALHKGWWTDPSVLHGVVHGAQALNGSHRKTVSPCEVMPTRGVLTTVLDCFRSICYASRYNADFAGKRRRDSVDRLLSHVVTSATRRPNLAYRLPVEELWSTRPDRVSALAASA